MKLIFLFFPLTLSFFLSMHSQEIDTFQKDCLVCSLVGVESSRNHRQFFRDPLKLVLKNV